jgi:hypothetical protein
MPVPMHLRTDRDCIIHEGTRYCESSGATSFDVGIILLVTLGALLWIAFWFYLGDRYESTVIALGGGLCLPLLVGGVGLILLGG